VTLSQHVEHQSATLPLVIANVTVNQVVLASISPLQLLRRLCHKLYAFCYISPVLFAYHLNICGTIFNKHVTDRYYSVMPAYYVCPSVKAAALLNKSIIMKDLEEPSPHYLEPLQ